MPEYIRLTALNGNIIPERLLSLLNEEDQNIPDEVKEFTYVQQLDKNLLSRSSVLGLGFGLMSPVLGMSTTMSIGLLNGGSPSIIFGYLICGIMTWICSLSLGEIVSKYPIELHGAAAMLSPDKLRLRVSWYCGWLMLFGSWTMSTSITFAGAQLIISLVTMTNESLIVSEWLTISTVLMFYLVVTIVGVINLKFARFIETINKVCVYWILYAILFTSTLLLLFQPNHRSLKAVFTKFDNSLSGYTSMALSFLIGGFQQSNFTFQGFAMLSALSDETEKPEKDIAYSMTRSVIIALISGLFFLIPMMMILPDVSEVMNHEGIMPIVLIFTKSTKSMFISIFLVLLILGNLLFSGIGSVTTSSRAVYSLSRDHGIPFHDLWTYVEPTSESKVPRYSVLLSMGVSYVLALLALVSTTAFNAFVGCAVICLCSASMLPILLSLYQRRKLVKGSAFRIKYRLGYIVNGLTVLWLLFTMIIISLPQKVPITLTSMNYSSVVYFIFLVAVTVLYEKWGVYNFRAPLVGA
ncbi:unnamed protein product [Kluyveromyces dobzhanskii CBS 2104]|uniref:WGS project CCBQ000000000 data, contig 00107 n=1 Tax=Kluyveromyces dobzhanskii CBS 2104 TaxID=1427455 RepID=A0A0A8L133_9SACH|nr:unnamed protein product [Kluyveromyces dobzhanskii CBS 2104]